MLLTLVRSLVTTLMTLRRNLYESVGEPWVIVFVIITLVNGSDDNCCKVLDVDLVESMW